MAATLRKIQDGSNRAVCVFTNPDATGETNAVKIDLNGGGTGLTLEANQLGQACTRVGIEKIWYSNIGMGVKILFKANANELAIELKEDWSDEICFKEFTSLRDSGTAGTNGDVLFTTVGAAGNDTYTIIISFKKYYG